MTLGLRRKTDDNDIETYRTGGALEDTMIEQMREVVLGNIVQEMRNYPEEFLNFGFNFNDFKAFLLKLVFMRAERRFIERGLNEKLKYEEANYNYRQGEQEEEHAAAGQP